MKFSTFACCFAILFSACTCSAQIAGPSSYVFKNIDAPNASATFVESMNATGAAVGWTTSSSTTSFLFDSDFHFFVFPESTDTSALGLNNDGVVVGVYYTSDNVPHGFALHNGTFDSVDGPAGSEYGFLTDVNDYGLLVGRYFQSSITKGFVLKDGQYTFLNLPRSYVWASPQGINSNGTIVGYYQAGNNAYHGFRIENGVFTQIDVPNAAWTTANRINDMGYIVGEYYDFAGVHGYVFDGIAFEELDAPGATWTSATGINDAGHIVGGYRDGSGNWHGVEAIKYTAEIQPPIDAGGSSVFKSSRGVVPVKFVLSDNGVRTCALPTATISLSRTGNDTVGAVDEGIYASAADSGSQFRIDSAACHYVYNLAASALGVGTYRVDISINGIMVGHAVFALK
jgi:probable HAF family extracellular repeat protein